MTIRDVISHQKRKTATVTFAGFALFALGGIAATSNLSLFIIPALLGFAIFMSGIFFSLFGIRCPRCRGQIGYTISYSGTPFTVSEKIRYCPCCGVGLDSQFNETQET